jgi:sulfopyruvate decarboxylase subunit alpha
MDIHELIHSELTKCGVTLAASLPDDWVAPLIRRLAADPAIRHVPVGREAEAIAICTGAFLAGVRSVAIMGTTGLHCCIGEMMSINLRHGIPVLIVCSLRGTPEDHQIYQEQQGRRTIPMLLAYDFPYVMLEKPEDIPRIPDVYNHSRLQKRPYLLFVTRRLLNAGKKP